MPASLQTPFMAQFLDALNRRHVRSTLSHSDADVGRAQGRGVSDAVASDRDKMPPLARRAHQFEFLFGCDAGKLVCCNSGSRHKTRSVVH